MPEARWFNDTRIRIHSPSLVESEARQGNMPPLHVHDEDETFYVLEGRLSLHLPGESVEIGPGESAFGPRGIPHTYRVESAEDARWLVTTSDGEFAAFVAETSSPAENGGYAPVEAMPAPEALAAAGARHGIVILGPPGALPAGV
ncbi:MAG: cupin domain-containing protein [Actinobacteria bacterium]|nr:cupin domain-containing protein [Actinomycetota bacterium]MBV8563153.1 cupin domain-containing protein [Actinomycetota bacterium]